MFLLLGTRPEVARSSRLDSLGRRQRPASRSARKVGGRGPEWPVHRHRFRHRGRETGRTPDAASSSPTSAIHSHSLLSLTSDLACVPHRKGGGDRPRTLKADCLGREEMEGHRGRPGEYLWTKWLNARVTRVASWFLLAPATTRPSFRGIGFMEKVRLTLNSKAGVKCRSEGRRLRDIVYTVSSCSHLWSLPVDDVLNL